MSSLCIVFPVILRHTCMYIYIYIGAFSKREYNVVNSFLRLTCNFLEILLIQFSRWYLVSPFLPGKCAYTLSLFLLGRKYCTVEKMASGRFLQVSFSLSLFFCPSTSFVSVIKISGERWCSKDCDTREGCDHQLPIDNPSNATNVDVANCWILFFFFFPFKRPLACIERT